MQTFYSKYLILGAGISGLTTGYLLSQSGITDFAILESRDRIGGRILTKDGIDFGATWFQNHHKTMLQMVHKLGLEKFHQRAAGKSILVYNPTGSPHYFESDPNAPAAFRVSGGTCAVVDNLARPILNKIHCNTKATEIIKIDNGVRVTTNAGFFETEKLVVTLPPKLAVHLNYTPDLPDSLIYEMKKTHTWMSNAIKVGLSFARPFWRHKGLSGMTLGQAGAVTELYDHSGNDGNLFCLMGFVNEGLRELPAAKRKSQILKYLTKFLGEEIMDYLTYEEKDWSLDEHTTQIPLAPLMALPRYGLPVFQSWYFEESLVFSGSETATKNGGYMDGALARAVEVANQIIN